MDKFVNTLFSKTIKNRERVIIGFKFFYCIQLVLLLTGFWSIYTLNNYADIFVTIGLKAGDLAVLTYCVTLIPGIARRFSVKHKLLSLLMIFRRYFGISMFLFVAIHFFMIRGAGFIRNGFSAQFALFELAGITAGLLLIPLFITSNDMSVQT